MYLPSSLIWVAVALGVVAHAQDIDVDDIPLECRGICSPVESIISSCGDLKSNDGAFLDCICLINNGTSFISDCETCVSTYDKDGTDNDVNDLRSSCLSISSSYNTTRPVGATPIATGSALQQAVTEISGTASTTQSALVGSPATAAIASAFSSSRITASGSPGTAAVLASVTGSGTGTTSLNAVATSLRSEISSVVSGVTASLTTGTSSAGAVGVGVPQMGGVAAVFLGLAGIL